MFERLKLISRRLQNINWYLKRITKNVKGLNKQFQNYLNLVVLSQTLTMVLINQLNILKQLKAKIQNINVSVF